VSSDDPPIDSPAQLVLLARKYSQEDKNIYTGRRMKHLRDKWMKLQMKTPDAAGGLTCQHCGRKGLQPWAPDIRDKAVLDHIVEITNNGSWRDPSNFQVLCDECNSRKNSHMRKIVKAA
jgi:5-methylcytosine-specific restriction endonuclease McrA